MADKVKDQRQSRVKGFVAEVREEGKRVNWPSRDKAKQAVVIVIAVTAILAVYIGIIDYFLSLIYRGILHI